MLKKIVNTLLYISVIFSILTISTNIYVYVNNKSIIKNFTEKTQERITLSTLDGLKEINKVIGENEIAVLNIKNIFYSLILGILLSLVINLKFKRVQLFLCFIFGYIIFSSILTFYVLYKRKDLIFKEAFYISALKGIILYILIFSIVIVGKILIRKIEDKKR